MTDPQLFDPDLLTADGMPRDCPHCKGAGKRTIVKETLGLEWTVVCRNCAGTGRAIIPFGNEAA